MHSAAGGTPNLSTPCHALADWIRVSVPGSLPSALSRADLALILLTEIAYENDEDFRGHLPLLFHVAFVSMDSRSALVLEHCQQLLVNLLYSLAGRHLHLYEAAGGDTAGSHKDKVSTCKPLELHSSELPIRKLCSSGKRGLRKGIPSRSCLFSLWLLAFLPHFCHRLWANGVVYVGAEPVPILGCVLRAVFLPRRW